MRPPLPSEAGAARVKLAVDERAGTLSMTHMRRDYTFRADGVLREEAGQEEYVPCCLCCIVFESNIHRSLSYHATQPNPKNNRVYDTAGIRGIVACVVHRGANASIFAYGCTGSGKSHTMQGRRAEEGIVPRALRQVLAAAADAEAEAGEEGEGAGCRVRISIFEIYQEKIRDLLAASDDAAAGAGAGAGTGKRKQSFGSSSSSSACGGRSSFLFGGSNGAHHHRASFAPGGVDRGGGVGARNSADLPVREDAKGNIIVPGLQETEVKVS